MKYVLILLLLIAGGTSTQAQKKLKRDLIKMDFSFKKPYTIDTKHYPIAFRYWEQDYYKTYIKQFPKKLKKSNEYELFFMPRVLQGGSSFILKITFPSEELAEKYFFEKTDGVFKVEFKDDLLFQESDYCGGCFLKKGIKTRYSLSNKSIVRLMSDPICSGKELSRNRMVSGIVLDRQNKAIVCWAMDWN